MIDMEKVIHGLHSCGFCDGVPDICGLTECPYRDAGAWCVHELTHDAGLLVGELLDEQEPVAAEDEHEEMGVLFSECGNCHMAIRRPWKYCPWCGRQVKWA